MEIFVVVFVIFTVFSLTVVSHWVDNKYNLQMVKWLNCEVSSPFKDEGHRQHAAFRDSYYRTDTKTSEAKEHDELRQRIENLEKIVTDSSWELNQKIKNL